ncbi:hypothetical protein MMC17_001153 [Xylographa soralifera]|nr:hypothetical protein [Xylographa soralifera]
MEHPEENPEVQSPTTLPNPFAEPACGWPHLLDRPSLQLSALNGPTPDIPNLIQAIPTMLHEYDPEFLEKFLDWRTFDKVTFIRQCNHGDSSHIIEREKNHLTCGYYKDIDKNGEKLRHFFDRIEYWISGTGKWSAGNVEFAGTTRHWSRGLKLFTGIDGHLAHDLQFNEFWKETIDHSIKASWSGGCRQLEVPVHMHSLPASSVAIAKRGDLAKRRTIDNSSFWGD